MSVWVLVVVELMALWLGYQVGMERGIKICQVKRRRFD